MPVTTASPRRRTRTGAPSAPLGSLTQIRTVSGCQTCGSHHVTRLAMQLTDGTPVVFTSCRTCEFRIWEHDGTPLSVEAVLDRTRTSA